MDCLTVHNAIITLGDTDDSGKGRHFKSRFIQPGVAGYPGQFGNVLIKKESLDRFIQTMVGVPVIINHKEINNDNADDERVGVVNSVWYDEKDGWYWCDGIIWDVTAQNLITDKNWSVSCSYDVKTADDKGGSENNIQYDIEFLDGVFTHLALVDNPRYERANIVFNSKDNLTLEQFTETFYDALTEVIVENCLGESIDNDKWITIKPHGSDAEDYKRLKLEDGESPKEAIERVYKKDNKKGKEGKENKKTIKHQTGKSFVGATNKTDALNETNNYVKDINPSIVSISLENLNKINSGLSYVYNNVCKFATFKEIKKSRMKALAGANEHLLVIGSMFNFDEQKCKEEFDNEVTNWIRDNEKAIERVEQSNSLNNRQKMARIKQYQENIRYKRFGVYSSPEDFIKETIIHELGHTIAHQAINKDRKIMYLIGQAWNKANQNGDIYNISQYANTNHQEFFAECFLQYNIGEQQPDYIKDMIETTIKML